MGPDIKIVRKRPIQVRAVQLTPGSDLRAIADWIGKDASITGNGIVIKTLEGPMLAGMNWWIIQGIKGEFYPCAPEVFAASYDIIN